MNEACCSRPAISSSYEPIGEWLTLEDGMRVYASGPVEAERAVVYIYDAFGYGTQQYLGADLLAATLTARVFIPDFFRGQGLPHDTFPMTTEEKKERLHKWLNGVGAFHSGAEQLCQIVPELRSKTPSATKWASVGFCWGGKVVAVSSGRNAPVDVSAACHPGRLEPAEARGFTIPHICLLSGEDGTPEEQTAYNKALQESGQDSYFEIFKDQVHGWMAARADLDNARVKEEYKRGYDLVAKFFEKHYKS